MNGYAFVAKAILAGSVFGFAPGVKLRDVEGGIRLSYLDEMRGSKNSKILRRDYGLFEVTLGNGPDWVCREVSLELHRLSASPELISEAAELEGVEFDQYTSWSDVRAQCERLADRQVLAQVADQHEYRLFRSPSTGVTVRVIGDLSQARGVYPGHGDVWNVEVSDPQYW